MNRQQIVLYLMISIIVITGLFQSDRTFTINLAKNKDSNTAVNVFLIN